jgi:hypothetical protein
LSFSQTTIKKKKNILGSIYQQAYCFWKLSFLTISENTVSIEERKEDMICSVHILSLFEAVNQQIPKKNRDSEK